MTEPSEPTGPSVPTPPRDKTLRTAILVDDKVLGIVNGLTDLTGLTPERVVIEALGYYRTIKQKEREGYFPAVVKYGKATKLVLENKE